MSQQDESKEEKNLGPSLMEVVANRGAIDSAIEASEAAIDGALDENVFRDVPIVGSIIGLAKAGISIRDYLFLRKLAGFLKSLEEIPEEKRDSFRNKINSDEELRERAGENIVLLLDRIDDMAKPELVGRAFAAYLSGEVDFDQFSRMASGIDRCFNTDLQRLREVKFDRIEKPWGMNLIPCGLAYQHVSQALGGGSTSYPLTETGKLVRQHCLLSG